jgi:ABC-type sugar transport system substrate-binding protein
MKNTRRALAFVALSATLAIPTLSEAAAQKTIAFMRGGPDPYYQYGMNAAQAAADKLGVKLVTYTANNDPPQELANV